MKMFVSLFLALLTVGILTAGEQIVKYPEVEIDLDQKEIRVDATMSTELMWGEPVIEFVLMRGAERGYETLFLTKADPAHVQLGLVMLGMKPWPIKQESDGGAAVAAPDAPWLIDLLIRWQTPGGEKTVPVENLFINRRWGKAALPMPFQFNGSYYYNNDEGKKLFAASSSGIFIALLRNPVALCNLPYFEPSPYGEEPAGYAVKIDTLPSELITTKRVEVADKDGVPRMVSRVVPKDTAVKIIFRISKTDPKTATKDPYAKETQPTK